MKRFLILLLISVTVFGQMQTHRDSKQKVYGKAIDCDGSEYASKTNPINMDLNGAPRCSTQTDMDFETSIGNWIDEGDPVIEQSNTYKHAGTYAMKVTTSIPGDGTTNYFGLPAANFTPLEAGMKVTVEGWGMGTGIVSETDLLAGWDFTSGWTGHSGMVVNDNNTFTAIINSGLYSTVITTVGKTYKLYVEGTTTSSELRFVDGYGAGAILGSVTVGAFSFTKYYIVSSTPTTKGVIQFVALGAGQTDITALTLQEVTLPSLTLVCGGQSFTKTNISCVPGTFTKVGWNFQATANEVGQPIRAYVNQADVTYWDDFSIKQSYDVSKFAWIKSSATGTKKMIMERYASSKGLQMYITTANKLEAVIGDGTYTVTETGTATNLCDGNWHFVGLTADRIGNMQLYVDGVVDGTATAITTLGDITSTTTLQIGYLSADYFSGCIGEIQRNRFTDIASSNTSANTIYSAYRNGLPRSWVNGTVVAHYKFRGSSDSEMLKDYSASGNNLVGTNVNTTDQVRGSYPSK